MRELGPNFWNFRGTFKIAGLIDIGTQMSLVRKPDGRFVLIDSYGTGRRCPRPVLRLTDDGAAIDAILNVHPFHTLHCEAVHRQFPRAQLVGTQRHRDRLPALPWRGPPIETEAGQAQFTDIFDFSVPDGVEFVCADEKVHVASVLIRHRESRIVHVDDTLNVLEPPGLLKAVMPGPKLRFHPMLSKALKPGAAAADAYADWARRLAREWADTTLVCTAHNSVLSMRGTGFARRILDALAAVEDKLEKHRRRAA